MRVSFNPHMWYKLTNAHCGPQTPLDIVNDNGYNSSGALKIAAWGPLGHSGQHWQIRPGEDGDGNLVYQLCTMFLGPAKCLDVEREDRTRPHLADAGHCAGQEWRIAPWIIRGSWDGTYKLWNNSSGKDMFLNTKEGSKQPCMAGGDLAGMHWIIEPIRSISSPEHMID